MHIAVMGRNGKLRCGLIPYLLDHDYTMASIDRAMLATFDPAQRNVLQHLVADTPVRGDLSGHNSLGDCTTEHVLGWRHKDDHNAH